MVVRCDALRCDAMGVGASTEAHTHTHTHIHIHTTYQPVQRVRNTNSRTRATFSTPVGRSSGLGGMLVPACCISSEQNNFLANSLLVTPQFLSLVAPFQSPMQQSIMTATMQQCSDTADM